MDLDGFTTAAEAAAPPGATTHGPAAEALLEGAEYDAETGDAAGASKAAAAAARVRPQNPSNWGAMSGTQQKCCGTSSGTSIGSSSGSTVARICDSKQHARLSRPAAQATAAGAMDLDGFTTAAEAVAPPGATTHGPAAEALLKGAEYDAETKDVAEASKAAAAAARVRPPRPSNWGDMSRSQRQNWKLRGGRPQ